MGQVGVPLVGRQAETALLQAGLTAAADGPVLVVLSGEAGVGKTRLLTAVAAEAGELGWRVLSGGCLRLLGGGLPYAPWTEVLRDLVRSDGRGVLTAALGDLAEGLGPMLPAGQGAQEIPAAHALEALLTLVEHLAAERPLLLGLEDLHWADPASLDALAFLVRNLGSVPVLLVATLRSDEALDDASRALLVELGRAPRSRQVDVLPLDGDATAALAVALGLDATGAASVHARTGGNPYYVTELVAAGDRPVTHLAEAVLTRLEGLPPVTRRALQALAVAGRPTPQGLLERVLGESAAVVSEALRALDARRLLGTGPQGHSPAHALAADAVLGHLLPAEREALHTAFADALDDEPALLADPVAVPMAIAEHRAAAGDDRSTLAAAASAARAAMAVRAYGPAAHWSGVALAVWRRLPDAQEVAGTTRGALLALAAEAAVGAGRPAAAVELVEQSLAEDDARGAEAAGLRTERLAYYLWRAGRPVEAAEASDRAAELLDGAASGPLARARAAQASTAMLLSRWDVAAQRCAQALEIAAEVGAVTEQAHALGTLGVVRAAQGRYEQGRDDADEAVALARGTGDVRLLWRSLLNGSYGAELAGELERAAELALQAVELSRRHGLDENDQRSALTNAVSPLVGLGRWSEVDALLADVPPGGADDPHARLLDRAAASLAVARGEPVEDALLAGAQDEPQLRQQRELLVAERALWAGEASTALDAVEAGLAVGGSPVDRAHLAALGLRAVADLLELPAGAGGPTSSARATLQERLARLLAGLPTDGSPETLALVAQASAEAGRAQGRDDAAAWEAVAAAWEAQGRPYPAALARWRQAAVSSGAERERVLRVAHGQAVRLGAAPLRRQLELLALRARVDLADGPPVVPAQKEPLDGLGLTRRERQVLALLATGASNRRIARELFITEKTASVHVSNTLGKLGVANRSEATAVAHRLGLAPTGGSTT